MRYLSICFIALLLASCAHSPQTEELAYRDLAAEKEILEGGNHGGGGSVYEVEFKAIAKNLAANFENAHEGFLHGVALPALKKVISESIVDSTFNLLFRDLNGRKKRVDALNYPKQRRILLSIPAWQKINSPALKEDLVLHEYLGLMGLEKDSYELSSKMLTGMRAVENYSPGERICSPSEVGFGDIGQWCLEDLVEKANKDLEDSYKDYIRTAKALKDSVEFAKIIKERMLSRVKDVKKNLPIWITSSCSLKTAALIGNPSGYYHTLCELELIQAQNKANREVINDAAYYLQEAK